MGPSVEFHTGVADLPGYVLRLLRKAVRQQGRVWVSGPSPVLDALDRDLWVADEQDFLAHGRVGVMSPGQARRTPLWLAAEGHGWAEASTGEAPRVWINLGVPLPEALPPWERILEIIGTDPSAVTAGRARWRDYLARGLEPVHRAGGAG